MFLLIVRPLSPIGCLVHKIRLYQRVFPKMNHLQAPINCEQSTIDRQLQPIWSFEQWFISDFQFTEAVPPKVFGGNNEPNK